MFILQLLRRNKSISEWLEIYSSPHRRKYSKFKRSQQITSYVVFIWLFEMIFKLNEHLSFFWGRIISKWIVLGLGRFTPIDSRTRDRRKELSPTKGKYISWLAVDSLSAATSRGRKGSVVPLHWSQTITRSSARAPH